MTAAVYAGGAFLAMSLNGAWLLIFVKWFRPERWTLGKELIVMVYQFFCIGLTIWLINHLRGTLGPEDASFGKSFFLAIAIGILPYMIATFGRHNYLLRHHLKEVAAFNVQLKGLQAQKEEQVFAQPVSGYLTIPRLDQVIDVNDFLFAESKGNNLVIQVCLNNRLQQYTLRSTLNDFARANAHIDPLFRCHRSFIINLDKVLQVQGNAAGYQVLLHPDLAPVVVARSSVPAFKKLLAGSR
ncbi:LytTR family transcriptional regulator DNA-binding domain-containing protein [Niabella pedocola]|uniref:LytTR family transcriptional regulator DNA-binding domain-containing protein n=1 Tax=Niabella pedocola TaxID=1752077 RepID=A0ABS8PRY1_9BACT|nr:LytTR family DNA-binding domain-containing protein [Niabella pedocola]MCD2423845.1 LytTR family transcriptional regulator DNA-binding domain-containing protein [Niabella pedocola]